MINSIENIKEFTQLQSNDSLNVISISRHTSNNKKILSECTNTPLKSRNTIEFSKSIVGNSADVCFNVSSFARLINEFAETYTESEYSLDINK